MQTEKTISIHRITIKSLVDCKSNSNFHFIFKFIVALDPLNKLHKSAGEKRHEDRSITGQTNSELSQTDYKWNDENRQLDKIGNLKVTTC